MAKDALAEVALKMSRAKHLRHGAARASIVLQQLFETVFRLGVADSERGRFKCGGINMRDAELITIQRGIITSLAKQGESRAQQKGEEHCRKESVFHGLLMSSVPGAGLIRKRKPNKKRTCRSGGYAFFRLARQRWMVKLRSMQPLRILLCVFGVVAMASAESPKGYYRFPAIHGDTVVFTAEGDLWRVPVSGGVAQRLTTHPGPETHPAISPDGQRRRVHS